MWAIISNVVFDRKDYTVRDLLAIAKFPVR